MLDRLLKWNPATILYDALRQSDLQVLVQRLHAGGIEPLGIEAVLALAPLAKRYSQRRFTQYLQKAKTKEKIDLSQLPLELPQLIPGLAADMKEVRRDLGLFLKGKRVVVTGPAAHTLDSKYQTLGATIDSYDVVVRLNFQWPLDLSKQPHLGQRCDLLYHCCNSDIDIRRLFTPVLTTVKFALLEQGIQSRLMRTYCQSIGLPTLYISDVYAALGKRLNAAPSTGLVAIFHLLSMPIASLQTIGMTFGLTPYYESYLGHGPTKFKSPNSRPQKIWKHDIKKEALFIKKLLKSDQRLNLDEVAVHELSRDFVAAMRVEI